MAAYMIRLARPTDADEIVHLTNQLGYDIRSPETAERIRRIVSRDDQKFLVAVIDDRPIAWVHATILEVVESEAFVIIAGLVVDKNYRRQGIARLLMSHVEEWARQRECFIVRLTSSSTRTGAHRFYEQLGYENIKTQYSFVRALDGAPETNVKRFVPRVDA
jgi:GNAT superfamily N-acetyltransferase